MAFRGGDVNAAISSSSPAALLLAVETDEVGRAVMKACQRYHSMKMLPRGTSGDKVKTTNTRATPQRAHQYPTCHLMFVKTAADRSYDGYSAGDQGYNGSPPPWS